MSTSLIIRQLGLQKYERVLLAMHRFTATRNKYSSDEIWLVQHHQVFTQGQSGKAEHILNLGNIPLIKSDRGGQITFHGPGQQLMYVLLDLHRLKYGIRHLVKMLEQIVIATLACFSIHANTRINAPGVYVGADKICSIGLRINKGYSFHGLALNVAMDLSPFLCINPCGYAGLRMTQISNLAPNVSIEDVVPFLIEECLRSMQQTKFSEIQSWDPKKYGV